MTPWFENKMEQEWDENEKLNQTIRSSFLTLLVFLQPVQSVQGLRRRKKSIIIIIYILSTNATFNGVTKVTLSTLDFPLPWKFEPPVERVLFWSREEENGKGNDYKFIFS